jgi:hypothetical protein
LAPERPREILSIRTTALADLRDDIEARKIVEAHLPGTFAALDMPQIGLLIEPMSLSGAQAMGGGKPEQLDEIERAFQELNARRGVHP